MILDTAATRRLVIMLVVMGMVWGGAWLVQTAGSPRPVPTLQPTFVAPTPAAGLTFVPPTSAPTSEAVGNPAPYPIYGPAAEIRDNVWLNTQTPLRLADLRGRVVLLEFWAFDCIPCMPVLSIVRAWYMTYNDQGLTVIGIHYPKVEDERSYDGLVAAVARLNIPYPVAQDNDGATWNAYGQRVWPTLSLIDKRGYLRYQQVGTGGYDAMEVAIRALLAEL